MTSRGLCNVLFACVLGIGSALAACGARSLTEVGGETNWLVVCNADSDCKQGSCECGVCTKTCNATSDCAGAFVGRCVAKGTEPAESLCAPSSTPPDALCLPTCEHDAACGDQFTCTHSACVPRTTAGADGGTDDPSEPDASVPTPKNQWTGNASACPVGPPANGGTCDAAEGVLCAYFYDDPDYPAQSNYNECRCREGCGTTGPVLAWDCYRNISSPKMACPGAQPEQGASCFGLKGYSCFYPPEIECRCPTKQGSDAWDCKSEAGQLPEHPTTIDESKRIADLSDSDRQAWCDWLTAREPGFPPPQELPPDSDGYYPAEGCASEGGILGCPGVLMPRDYPASACVANLALSSCEATLGDLTDCVLTVRTRQPAPHGCARYLSAPGCGDTIILATGDSAPDACSACAGVSGGSMPTGADACRLRVQ